jgi:protein involved in polysaccharide export with SLBB domain
MDLHIHMSIATRWHVLGLLLASLVMTPSPSFALDAPSIRVGDKLKVTFFETMDVPDPMAGNGNSAAAAKFQMFYQRLDLSGEYVVEPGGKISVPILGEIAAAGQPVEDVKSKLLTAMRKSTGRSGNVTVAITQRPPIYVAGAVRNPGAYAFSGGMIAIQAIALAGGLEKDSMQTAQLFELLRRKEAAAAARDRLARALAQKAQLIAVRDNTKEVVTPPRLIEMVGADGAAALMASERRLAELRAQSQHKERSAKTEAIPAIQEEIGLINERLSNLDVQIKSRGEQLQKMEALFARQVVNDERVTNTRRDYMDLEGRRNEMKVNLVQATRRLAQAEADPQRMQLAQRLEVEAEINKLDRQIAETDASGLLGEAATVLALEGGCGPGAIRLEIVRNGATGAEIIAAVATTSLEPGDVLQATATCERVSNSKPVSSAARPPAGETRK